MKVVFQMLHMTPNFYPFMDAASHPGTEPSLEKPELPVRVKAAMVDPSSLIKGAPWDILSFSLLGLRNFA